MKILALLLTGLALTGCSNNAQTQVAPSIVLSESVSASLDPNVLVDTRAEVDIADFQDSKNYLELEELSFQSSSIWISLFSGYSDCSINDFLVKSWTVSNGLVPLQLPLDSTLLPGSYTVCLHLDDGDEKFSAETDRIVVDEDGEVESEDFEVR